MGTWSLARPWHSIPFIPWEEKKGRTGRDWRPCRSERKGLIAGGRAIEESSTMPVVGAKIISIIFYRRKCRYPFRRVLCPPQSWAQMLMCGSIPGEEEEATQVDLNCYREVQRWTSQQQCRSTST